MGISSRVMCKNFYTEKKEYYCVFQPQLLSSGYELEVVLYYSARPDCENTLIPRPYYILSPEVR